MTPPSPPKPTTRDSGTPARPDGATPADEPAAGDAPGLRVAHVVVRRSGTEAPAPSARAPYVRAVPLPRGRRPGPADEPARPAPAVAVTPVRLPLPEPGSPTPRRTEEPQP